MAKEWYSKVGLSIKKVIPFLFLKGFSASEASLSNPLYFLFFIFFIFFIFLFFLFFLFFINLSIYFGATFLTCFPKVVFYILAQPFPKVVVWRNLFQRL
jgi:hypothetical protein